MPEAPKLRVAIPRGVGVAFDGFYRSGALVFGGGHVVLPLLEQEVVPTGWVSKADFLAGYGAAQAVPGPLFTFAGYLGALISINAAVVGILLAALYNPVWTSAVLAPVDFALVAVLFLLLIFWKLPPWLVVLTGALGGALLGWLVSAGAPTS